MELDLDYDLDIYGFERAISALVGSGAITKSDPVRFAIREETAQILKTCALRTKIMEPEQVERRTRRSVAYELQLTSKFDSPVTITTGFRAGSQFGKVWRRTAGEHADGRKRLQQTHAGDFIPLHRHYKNADWVDICEAIKDYSIALRKALPLARKSAGLARQSWIQIADNLGIRLEDYLGSGDPGGLAKARSAVSRKGIVYQNGKGSEYAAAEDFIIKLQNNFPYGQRAGLDRVFVSVFNARVNKFRKNLTKGIFDSAKKTLKAYPGLKIAAA